MTRAWALLALAALAADWPQFRGPNGTGLSSDTNLPVEMTPEKNVAWKTAIPTGFSDPVLVGSRIFLTAVEQEVLLTLCLDRATGKILWRREAPRPRKEIMHKPNSPASPSAASDGQSVFVFFGDYGMLAYGMDGEERWRLPLGPFNNQNGHGSSPIVAGDLVVLICDQDTDSYLLAVDKKSGKVRWKVDRPGITRGYSTPVLWRGQLIVTGAYELISYDAKTGAKIWWVNGTAWQTKGVPVVADDTIYINTWETGGDFETPPTVDPWDVVTARLDTDKDGRLSPAEAKPLFRNGFYDYDLNKDGFLDAAEWEAYKRLRAAANSVMAIRPQGKGDLTSQVMWRYRKSLPNVPSPLLYGGALFLVKDGGIVTTLNPATGEVVKQGRIPGATEQFWSSPVGADGKVYMLSQGCKLAVLAAQPQWEVMKLNDLDDECFATPAIADQSLYVRTKNWLYSFREKEPQTAAKKPFQEQGTSTIKYGVNKDGQETVEIVNVAYDVTGTNIPGRPPLERLLVRKTIRSKQVLGDIGVESKITLESWPLGADTKQKPLYTVNVEGTDAKNMDNALVVASRGLEEVEWWSVYQLGSGKHLFDTYVPVVSFSISRAELTLRYTGLEVPPDDTKDARLKDPKVVAVLTYASAARVIREALITCDDANRAQQLRSYSDEERRLTRNDAGALRIAFSQSYPAPAATVTVTIPLKGDDLDLEHAQLPAGLHVAAWKR